MSNQWQQFLAVRAEIEGRLREPEESVEEWLDGMQTEAYEEGRKDEREASCVDELLDAARAALIELYRVSPSIAAPKLRAAIAKATGEQP